jgi:hypothetical protein
MKINNIRFGFATNSSSTHSIVFLPNISDSYDYDQSFGWDGFTIASAEGKRAYVGQAIKEALLQTIDSDDYETKNFLAAKAASLIVGINVNPNGGIDHQSCPDIPLIGNHINKEYADDLLNYLMRKDLVILGGNDNEDNTHPLLMGHIIVKPPYPSEESHKFIGRKDGGWWTLFDNRSGTKTRFSFEDNPGELKLTTPDLVDLKITNYCEKGCLYCYQSSSREGKHADFDYLKDIIKDLAKNKVFEVALGGGEPTSHPKFIEIIEYCHENGIVPNFSTRQLYWLDNEITRKRVIDKIGAFAYSIDHPGDVKELYGRVIAYGIDDHRRPRCNIQVALGTIYDSWLDDIFKSMEAARNLGNYHMGITLLDYKAVGRGARNKPEPYGDWIKLALSYQVSVGIDTPLAKKSEEELKKSGVSKLLYNTEEGKTSCYIDAVDRKIGPCSYEPDKLEDFRLSDWAEKFQRFAGLEVVVDPLKGIRKLDLDD